MDGTNWGMAIASLDGNKKGKLEITCPEVSSASPIYVKIENTSTGDLNIHGANIRLASNNPNNVSTVNNNRAIIREYRYVS